MEAYILHIQCSHLEFHGHHYVDNAWKTYKLDEPKRINKNVYSAWCTEKQAYKEASRLILESIEKSWSSERLLWDHLPALNASLTALIKNDFIQEALDLVSEYDFSNTQSKMTIKITVTKSTFKGSAFE